ncbi:MAG: glycosyltransferase [Acidobacteriota bacterium]
MSSPQSIQVAFVMPGMGVVKRGAEVFVGDLCRALGAREDFDVLLLSRGVPEPDVLESLAEAPLPVRVLHREHPLLSRVYDATRFGRKVLDTLFLDPLNIEWGTAALSALGQLRRRRRRTGDWPDVLVMEGGLVGGWVARWLRWRHGVPFVDIAHGNSPKWEGTFARQRPDRVVAFTEAAAAMIQARAPKAQVEVIPHGVDLERFHPEGERATTGLGSPLILSAGSIDEHKRPRATVEAVSRLAQRGFPQASLLMLGEGPEAEAVDALAAERLGEGRYRRLSVPREEMPSWYRAAQVFALPSVTEAFGLVYLEALACGLPCVAPHDGVRRTVIGEAGVLCPDPEDPDLYAADLELALKTHWGERPRRQAEGFPFAATAEAYARLFRSLAGRAADAEASQ